MSLSLHTSISYKQISMMKDLPDELICNILQRVAKFSCVDVASLKATSPALRGVVDNNESSLYKFINISPLLKFPNWSNAHSEFFQKCVDSGNTTAQFWFGLVSL